MLPDKIYLIDKSKELVEAWSPVFEDIEIVGVFEGDFFPSQLTQWLALLIASELWMVGWIC
ncbi:hypothetical protein ACJJI5_07420 [Microbulbifer sp. EKSA008]|uniref:hypothetical protein n=1 Tax=unclassified Microbulbifer TaxID=2619833 RepID=UPI0040438F31